MPRDEPLDDLDGLGASSRRGAHRARRDASAVLVPVLLVGLAVAGLLVGVNALLGPGDEDPAAASPTPGTPSASTPATPTPTDGATATASPSATATTTEEPTDEPTGEVDRSTTIRVLNGTGAQGLAASGRDRLEEAGWTVSGVDNYSGTEIATTAFVADEDQRATAEAVLAELLDGEGLVEVDPVQAGDGITVVLGADYEP